MTAIGLASAADSGRNGLARVRAIARWWDEAFRVPVLGWRVGLDAVVGLVPGLGDLIGLVVSGLLIVDAVRLGTGRAVVARMVLNVIAAAIAARSSCRSSRCAAMIEWLQLAVIWIAGTNRVDR